MSVFLLLWVFCSTHMSGIINNIEKILKSWLQIEFLRHSNSDPYILYYLCLKITHKIGYAKSMPSTSTTDLQQWISQCNLSNLCSNRDRWASSPRSAAKKRHSRSTTERRWAREQDAVGSVSPGSCNLASSRSSLVDPRWSSLNLQRKATSIVFLSKCPNRSNPNKTRDTWSKFEHLEFHGDRSLANTVYLPAPQNSTESSCRHLSSITSVRSAISRKCTEHGCEERIPARGEDIGVGFKSKFNWRIRERDGTTRMEVIFRFPRVRKQTSALSGWAFLGPRCRVTYHCERGRTIVQFPGRLKLLC